MLLYNCKKFNGFSQLIYSKHVRSINLQSVVCPVCHEKSTLSLYGTYPRSYYTDNGTITIRVQRCQCSRCNSTHAILPSFTIPYSRISLPDACDILTSENLDDILVRLSVAMDTIRRIRRRFSLWVGRLSNYDEFSFFQLTSICISTFGLQFLQTRPAPISFIMPT